MGKTGGRKNGQATKEKDEQDSAQRKTIRRGDSIRGRKIKRETWGDLEKQVQEADRNEGKWQGKNTGRPGKQCSRRGG